MDTVPIDARDLHTYLQSKTAFSEWIHNRLTKRDFKENQDFAILISEPNEIKIGHGGDRRSVDYALTIRAAMQIAMVENNNNGQEVRQYFIRIPL